MHQKSYFMGSWAQEEGIYFLSYKLREDDFEAFNQIVMEDITKKKQKKQIVFGMISTMIVAIILITFLVTRKFQGLFLGLTLLLLFFSLFAVLYFPVIFPRTVHRAVRERFKDETDPLNGRSYRLSIGEKGIGEQETLADGFLADERFILWDGIRRIYIYDVGIVLMENATEGIFLPSRILERDMDDDVKSYVVKKGREHKILTLFER